MPLSRRLLLCVLGLWMISISSMSHAEELYIIAHPSIELTSDDIRDAYLGDKTMINGVKLSLTDNEAIQAEFLNRIIKMDAGKYQALWSKKGFRDGLTAPSSKASDVDVIAYVRRTPGSVGYVSKLTALPTSLGIRVVYRVTD